MILPAEPFEISGREGYNHHQSSRTHFIEILTKRKTPDLPEDIIKAVFEQDPWIGFSRTLTIHYLSKDKRKEGIEGKDHIWFLTTNRLTAIGSYYSRHEDFIHAVISYNLDEDKEIDMATYKYELFKGTK